MRWAGAERGAEKWEAGTHSPALLEQSISQRNMGVGTPLMAALPAGGSSYPSQESVPQVGTGLDLLTVKEAGISSGSHLLPLFFLRPPSPAPTRTLSLFKKSMVRGTRV